MFWRERSLENFLHAQKITAMVVLQGTAATAVSGIYGALAVQGKPVKAITEQASHCNKLKSSLSLLPLFST
jgi:hypothetical protein